MKNSGIVVGGPLETVLPSELRRQFEVNAIEQLAVTRRLVRIEVCDLRQLPTRHESISARGRLRSALLSQLRSTPRYRALLANSSMRR